MPIAPRDSITLTILAQSRWSVIVARVKSQMETISNIGLVHGSWRVADSENKWAESSGTGEWNRLIQIQGLLEIDWDKTEAESTEQVAIGLSESVIRTLNKDLWQTKLGGTVLTGKQAKLVEHGPRLADFVIGYGVRIEMQVLTIDSLT
jgi:hypothetical protein